MGTNTDTPISAARSGSRLRRWYLRACAAVFALALSNAFATTYYVDYAAGSDAASGTSAATAWKHCPGDPNATGNANISLSPGDTVYFHGGVTYHGNIGLNWSGTPGNPITYDGTTWGSGARAILTDDHNQTSTVEMDSGGASRSYLTITGLEFYAIGGYADNDPVQNLTPDTAAVNYYLSHGGAVPANYIPNPVGGTGIAISGGRTTTCDHITITNCYFHEIGQWRNDWPAFGSIPGGGIVLRNATNCTVSNCEMTRTGNIGVQFNTYNGIASGDVVQNCHFHDYVNWGVDLSAGATGSTSNTFGTITITACTFADNYQYMPDHWQSEVGVGVRADFPHEEYIFLRTGNNVSSWSNVTVENCLFYSTQTDAAGGSGSIALTQGPSATIFNCVFLMNPEADGEIVLLGYPKPPAQTNPERLKIYNCTFVSTSKALDIHNTNPDLVDVRNCLFYRLLNNGRGTYNIYMDPSEVGANPPSGYIPSFIFDYNVYWNLYTPVPNSQINRYNFSTFSTWSGSTQRYAGGYSRGPLTAVVGAHSYLQEPGLVKISTAGSDPSTWNVRPASASSVLVGHGQNLTGLGIAGLDKDKDGNSRPATGPWDIGAYQYQGPGGSPAVAAPSNASTTVTVK